ncbi:MAG TPA: tRNA preQ1(34) S-adenosylmethionine ribosyltransferase-isomerase QueA [Steroidobacteraceae bacterium]|nr:tRNA preQ1(34) S-adenosylmethionine ribosyltransferase-isomerase QueA [Steroidobacteraceae bacterium]
MRRADFSYELPEELIAQTPLAERSASRLLVLDGQTGQVSDRVFRDLPALLRAGDLLVFNDTRVVAARLLGFKPSGGRVEIFLERPLGERGALVQLRASKPIREELEIATVGGSVRVVAKRGELWEVALPAPALEFFERWGEVPLPPYIRRAASGTDRERYQSIFAEHPGAVAAPTASLHFDAGLVERLDALGVQRAFVTLHVGAGTFQPVRVDDISLHVMHAEWLSVGAETCAAIASARAAGGRVIAVGTTVARALESAALASAAGGAEVAPFSGDTSLFITPGFQFRVVDALITNFHLPESTLLMLVAAFAGREHVLAAYEHAVRLRYRFFSYGDAMFVTSADPQRSRPR